jgi:hypothetical protein
MFLISLLFQIGLGLGIEYATDFSYPEIILSDSADSFLRDLTGYSRAGTSAA